MDKKIMEQIENNGTPIDTNDVAIYEQILVQSHGWIVPESRQEGESWAAIQSRLKGNAKVVLMTPVLKWAASIAAVIVIALSILFIQPGEETYFADQITDITLSDGSVVTLNAGSSMSYSENIFGNRNITFDGKGFFEVTPGKEFTVETSNGTVTVLGTSFNVSSFNDDFIVKCYTGKVKVESIGNEAILTPGLEVKALNGKFSGAEKFDATSGKEWVDGIFSYNNEPLINVFSEIEKQFGIEIILTSDNFDRSFSGLFSNKDNIDEVLKTVCSAMGLTFELIETNKYSISE